MNIRYDITYTHLEYMNAADQEIVDKVIKILDEKYAALNELAEKIANIPDFFDVLGNVYS